MPESVMMAPEDSLHLSRSLAPHAAQLTRPNTRPALLRISSRLSGFFFWGIRLLPVLGTEVLGLLMPGWPAGRGTVQV